MNSLFFMAVVLQALIPVLLILGIALGYRRSRLLVALDTAIAALYVYAIAIAGLWLALPHWLPWLYVAALTGGTLAAFLRRTERRRTHPVALVARFIALVSVAAVTSYGLAGRRAPPHLMQIEFPLPSGKFIVANGGTNVFVNAHYETLNSARLRAYRGQSFGVDIIGVGAWGSRKGGVNPRDPRRYSIFGTTVIAPCTGEVIAAVDGLDDMPVPIRDREHLEGNHVILDCDGAWVLLAHLRRGSVRKHVGDVVRTGDVLGEVGNSGNSDEPHLHVHVQKPGTTDAPLSGDPIPVRFGSRWLTRNNVVATR